MIRTKKIIRATFWEILEEKPYNKITVQDIVDRCGVNRNTFYYHFHDVPSLMLDSIEDWTKAVIREYGTFETPADCLNCVAVECTKMKKALLHLFRSVPREKFLAGMNKLGYDIIREYVDEIEGYKKIPKEEKENFIRCYKCVFVGSLLEWLEEDASYDLKEFYGELCKIFAGASRRAISVCEDQTKRIDIKEDQIPHL